MRKIIFTNQQEQRIPIPNGRVMTVSPGRIHGLFSLENFADPACCSEDEGFSKLTFDFKSLSQQSWRHTAILFPMNFWPAPDMVVRKQSEVTFVPQVTLPALLDYREEYLIAVEDGRTLGGFFKYVDTRFDTMVEEGKLSIRNKFYYGKPFPGLENQGYVTIYYALPYDRVLWKMAPQRGIEELIVQGADFVQVEEVGPLELEASPVTIT